ncbi:aspartate kinase [Patescibacteria group bacterium]|nr:aspartate kinase [Patescibacteria group bacterium]
MTKELLVTKQNGFMNDCDTETATKPLLVMKFGGTSVGGPIPIARTTSIIERYTREGNSLVVVASAIKGVTDSLVGIGKCIQDGKRLELELGLEDIFYRHLDVANNLNLSHPLKTSLNTRIEELFFELYQYASELRGLTSEKSDRILSYGERLSIRIVQAKLLSRGLVAETVDATEIIETDDNFGQASPDIEKTARYARDLLLPMVTDGVIPIVTGFIGSTRYRKTTTLGRGGSDYTASILGKVLDADEVWIWTDVDGVYSADPRKEPNAQFIPELSQVRAHQMAMAGARVLYPKTIEPLMGTGIDLWVKNTFNPDAAGTRVYYKTDSK